MLSPRDLKARFAALKSGLNGFSPRGTLTLAGALRRFLADPITPEKAAVELEKALAGRVEVGYGCGNPVYTDEMHVSGHMLAVIARAAARRRRRGDPPAALHLALALRGAIFFQRGERRLRHARPARLRLRPGKDRF